MKTKSKERSAGFFVVSLDFEKLWGMIDRPNYESYKQNVRGVDEVLPQIIELSDRHGIKLTIATVGLLFCDDKREIEKYSPVKKPSYSNKAIQPYGEYIACKVGTDGKEDRLHYAFELISNIKKPHEIASHTFSHYYCNAEGQTCEEFEADLIAAKKIANEKGYELLSIVFPRNECREDYLKICKRQGFAFYRGNELNRLHDESRQGDGATSLLKRALRLIDAYLPITGHNTYNPFELKDENGMLNIRASRFLRPYSKVSRLLDWLKLWRIKRDMNHAARHGRVYHLWWHPHNFGNHPKKNLDFLKKIYLHYEKLNSKYNFQSAIFSDIGKIYNE